MNNHTSSHLDRVLNRIREGQVATGTVVNLTDPMVSEIVASAGVDFVWIDLEHSAMGNAELNMHVLAARSRGVAPFVRVPWNDPVRVKPVLEMGPAGVIFPFINGADEAKAAVAACRYPPVGVRGFCPHRAIDFGTRPVADYMQSAAVEPWVVLQIEHIEAVQNIDAICAVEGIGSLLIGPFDLSVSIGKPGQVNDPEMVEHYERIVGAARKHGIPSGAFASAYDEPGIARWLQRGVSWLALDMEYAHIVRGVQRGIEAVRRQSVGAGS